MRDGVRLAANVFLPTDRTHLPAIPERTPCGRGPGITPNYQAFVDCGYTVVVEDVRGRYESEGVFRPLEQEPADGHDTLNWIAANLAGRQSRDDRRFLPFAKLNDQPAV